jgi:hypothetical protein
MGKVNFGRRFVEAVAKTFERGALTVFFLGAVVGLPIGGAVVFAIGEWLNPTKQSSMQERLDSANQRALTAETMSSAANKEASQAKSALQELKAKYEEELSGLRTQVQGYQKADEIRKKNDALQKPAAKRPKKSNSE